MIILPANIRIGASVTVYADHTSFTGKLLARFVDEDADLSLDGYEAVTAIVITQRAIACAIKPGGSTRFFNLDAVAHVTISVGDYFTTDEEEAAIEATEEKSRGPVKMPRDLGGAGRRATIINDQGEDDEELVDDIWLSTCKLITVNLGSGTVRALATVMPEVPPEKIGRASKQREFDLCGHELDLIRVRLCEEMFTLEENSLAIRLMATSIVREGALERIAGRLRNMMTSTEPDPIDGAKLHSLLSSEARSRVVHVVDDRLDHAQQDTVDDHWLANCRVLEHNKNTDLVRAKKEPGSGPEDGPDVPWTLLPREFKLDDAERQVIDGLVQRHGMRDTWTAMAEFAIRQCALRRMMKRTDDAICDARPGSEPAPEIFKQSGGPEYVDLNDPRQ